MEKSSVSLASTSFSSTKFLTTSSSSLVSFTPQVFFQNKSLNLNKVEILRRRTHENLSVEDLTLEFSGSFYEGGVETVAVLRPDMTEDKRLTIIQKYEEDERQRGGETTTFKSNYRLIFCFVLCRTV
ncbi:hypothetical protein MKX03_027638 [Papaver bracteatum]|nr:hypothetical protein MKX03_027638 [Papaver bracteatum]